VEEAAVLRRLTLVEYVLGFFVAAIEYDIGERASDPVRLEELSLTMRSAYPCPDSHWRVCTEISVREFKHDHGYIVARQEILPRPLEVVPSAHQVLEKRIAPATGEKAIPPSTVMSGSVAGDTGASCRTVGPSSLLLATSPPASRRTVPVWRPASSLEKVIRNALSGTASPSASIMKSYLASGSNGRARGGGSPGTTSGSTSMTRIVLARSPGLGKT